MQDNYFIHIKNKKAIRERIILRSGGRKKIVLSEIELNLSPIYGAMKYTVTKKTFKLNHDKIYDYSILLLSTVLFTKLCRYNKTCHEGLL